MQTPSLAESGVTSMVDKETEAHDESLQEKSEEILEDESNYATGLRLGLIVTGLTLSVLLVALVSLYPNVSWPSFTKCFRTKLFWPPQSQRLLQPSIQSQMWAGTEVHSS
jgi:hypothetical protein